MKFTRLLFVSIWILFSFCDRQNSIFEPELSVNYTYHSCDSLGNILRLGTLTFEFEDSAHFTGFWNFYKPNGLFDTGHRAASGKLIGTMTDTTVFINLNPNYKDNNVYLTGILSRDRIEGKWMWETFSGISNWGYFLAMRK